MDFTFEPPTELLGHAMASREDPGKTTRTPVERRQSTSPVARKRRRHDGLHSGKRTPRDW